MPEIGVSSKSARYATIGRFLALRHLANSFVPILRAPAQFRQNGAVFWRGEQDRRPVLEIPVIDQFICPSDELVFADGP